MFNLEWHREKFSRMEKTLRFPRVAVQALLLFVKRILPIWFIFFVVLDLLLWDRFFIWTLSILGYLVVELHTLRKWYLFTILPKHEEKVGKSIDLYNACISDPKHAYLFDFIEEMTNNAAWSLVNIGYSGIAAWIWEFILRFMFKVGVKPCDVLYSDLLIGFESKTVELNQALWKVAQIDADNEREQALEDFRQEYGNRVNDWDLKHPTLRESPDYLKTLLGLYRSTEAPKNKTQEQEEKRTESTKKVLENLRIPKRIFEHVLNQAQLNIPLREDRRFHEFRYDYYIRQLLFLVAEQKQIDHSDLFDKDWKEI